MKQESTLPKTFQKMLGQLKRLDDELGITIRPYEDEKEVRERKKREERKKLLERIWESWPRKMVLNKEVLQMRGNALKNPEIKAFLNKGHIRIEDCALISFWDELNRGQQHDCPGFCSPRDIQENLAEWGWGNVWLARYDYCWGGPKDPVKILFEKTKNNLFRAIGVIQMFPEKMKRAA
jgi:hypothetical protein